MKNTATKKNRRRALQRKRRRERLVYTLTAVFASLCVFSVIGVVLLVRNNAPDQSDVWVVPDAGVEIEAAPAQGGAVVFDTPGPDIQPPAFVSSTQSPTEEPTQQPTEEPTLETVEPVETLDPASMAQLPHETGYRTLTLTAAGDITLGGDYNSDGHKRFDDAVRKNGYDYFLQNVRGLFESDDLTFVNLEGPLTASTDKRSGRTFNFKGAPEFVNILSGSSIEMAGLANNHALDFGTNGLYETAQVLESAGIGYCGYTTATHLDVNGIDVCCLSVTEWDYTAEDICNMIRAERENSDLVLVMIHWGEEKNYSATKTQKEYGHAIIDAGADLVLGSHSHVVGGVELYNGKYIVYSLGNFCFGGNKHPSDMDCMLFQQTFLVDETGAQDGGICIIPCRVSSDSGINNFQPVLLYGSDAARVLGKVAQNSNLSLENTLWLDKMQEYFAAAN